MALTVIPIARLTVIQHIAVVGRIEVIPSRGADRQADTEGRLCRGTEDDTSRHIETRTLDAAHVRDSHGTDGIVILIHQCLSILAIATIVHTLHANGEPPVEAIV